MIQGRDNMLRELLAYAIARRKVWMLPVLMILMVWALIEAVILVTPFP